MSEKLTPLLCCGRLLEVSVCISLGENRAFKAQLQTDFARKLVGDLGIDMAAGKTAFDAFHLLLGMLAGKAAGSSVGSEFAGSSHSPSWARVVRKWQRTPKRSCFHRAKIPRMATQLGLLPACNIAEQPHKASEQRQQQQWQPQERQEESQRPS